MGLTVSIKMCEFWVCCHGDRTFNETFTSTRHHMSMLSNPDFWHGRLKAAGIHLAISLAIAALAALLVFFVWYPYPYREISGGRELFLLVVVDVIMGPLMTLAVFNLNKPRKELRRDLAVIGVLQLAALVYGLWTVAVARPVHLVYEIDRFRVVHAIDIEPAMLKEASPEFQQLPLMGPTLLSVRNFRDNKEKTDITLLELAGVPLGSLPNMWQAYEIAASKIIAAAKPVNELKTRFPARSTEIKAALKSVPASTPIGYIPLQSRGAFWTVLIDLNTAQPVGYLPLDPY
jgi:hypothetical protein